MFSNIMISLNHRLPSLLLFIFLFYPPAILPAGRQGTATKPVKPLLYRFHYTFQGGTTGTLLLIFRYRFFTSVNASVFFEALPAEDNSLRFRFKDIDGTGYILRTWGFSGRTLVMAAVDYDLKKGDLLLKRDMELLRQKDPQYAKLIKHRKKYLFRLTSRAADAITFTREKDGRHIEESVNMPVKKIRFEEKFGVNVKIFEMLLEMVKLSNHSLFPGFDLSQLKPGAQNRSVPLDFSKNLDRIGGMAARVIEKYIRFKQERPFSLHYNVLEGSPGTVLIKGEAAPEVTIYGNFKIKTVSRVVRIRKSDGVLLEDGVEVTIGNKKGKGGFARCKMELVQ